LEAVTSRDSNPSLPSAPAGGKKFVSLLDHATGFPELSPFYAKTPLQPAKQPHVFCVKSITIGNRIGANSKK